MEALIAGIGIIGTLVAAATTQLMANKAAQRVREEQARERMVDLRRDGMAGFAEAVMTYRRAQMAAWHAADTQGLDHDLTDLSPEARDRRAQAWAAFFRVQLSWNDEALIERCGSLLESASKLKNCDSREALHRAGDQLRDGLKSVVADARSSLVGDVNVVLPVESTR